MESIDQGDHVCYVLKSQTKPRTYCGYTNAFWQRRILAHNGLKTGGAKYTRVGRPYFPLFIVKGFRNKKEALHFEYGMKHTRLSSRGVKNRLKCLNYMINKERWTKKCDLAKDIPLKVIWFDKEAFDESKLILEKPDYVTFHQDFTKNEQLKTLLSL